MEAKSFLNAAKFTQIKISFFFLLVFIDCTHSSWPRLHASWMTGSDRQAISEQVAPSQPGVIFNALKIHTSPCGVLPARETSARGPSSSGCPGACLDQMERARGMGHESLLSFPRLTADSKKGLKYNSTGATGIVTCIVINPQLHLFS